MQSQRRPGTSSSAIVFPAWLAETAERNEHRLGGIALVVGIASIVWGAIAITLAAVIFVL